MPVRKILNALKVFWYYTIESKKEMDSEIKLYFSHILLICLICVVQSLGDFYFEVDNWPLRLFSKMLFSSIQVLILAKILYISKIRFRGFGDYREVLIKYLAFSGLYFLMILLAAALFIFSLQASLSLFSVEYALIFTLPILAPFFYFLFYFSLSPIVAVFAEDEEGIVSIMKTTKMISQKNLSIVFLNHFFSFIAPLLFSLVILIKEPETKLTMALLLAFPEAFLIIMTTILTVRVYLYLHDVE